MLPDHLENLYTVLEKTGHPYMPLDMLDGYLCAVISSPEMIPPPQWMPGVFFDENMPEFSSTEEAQTLFSTLLEYHNHIIASIDSGEFGVVIADASAKISRQSLELWCEGFAACVALNDEEWIEGLESEYLTVTLLIFEIAHNSIDDQKGRKKKIIPSIRTKKQINDFYDTLNVFVPEIYFDRGEQFKEKHPVVQHRKTDKPAWGRNEPCPCSSGKKFKKCCGSLV